jgi:DNA-binding IclR family transcriptional regulator
MTPLTDIAIAPIPAQVLRAAAELRIADLLAEGPRTTAELAQAADAHEPSLRRLLLALAGLGIVAQLDGDRFELRGREAAHHAGRAVRVLGAHPESEATC